MIRQTLVHAVRCALITCFFVTPASAATPEEIFQEAIKYTVVVRSSIETPFSFDEEGVFSGTGFVVDVDRGWILTNAHLAGYSPSRIEIAFPKTEFFEADKLYIDPHLDVAVLQVPADRLPEDVISAPIECAEDPPVGHPVGAFGHPWSLTYTGTRGIISGTTFLIDAAWLQTDAPINDGNSGGPLISMQTGRLVGINTASVDDENIEGMNFAVPMRFVCKILALLREGKDPSPPNLPIRFFDHDHGERLVVADIDSDSRETALVAGDVIRGVESADDAIQDESELLHLLRGRTGLTNLFILRDGKKLVVPIQIQLADKLIRRIGLYVSGMVIASSSYAKETMLDLSQMLMVHSVKAGTEAQSAGLEAWDFIKTVDGKRFDNMRDLFDYLSKANEIHRDVEIVLKRIDDKGYQLFSYKKVRLPIENLKMIGVDAD